MNIRALALLGVAMAACDANRDLTTDEVALVTRYLECIECSAGELRAIVDLARQRPAARDTLRVRLLDGPAPDRTLRAAAGYGAGWTRDTTVRRMQGDTLFGRAQGDSAGYVDTNLGRLDRLTRIRAAMVLGCTGTPEALRAIGDPALLGRQPAMVREWLGRQVDSLRNQAYRSRTCR